jgi:hypothetical protein
VGNNAAPHATVTPAGVELPVRRTNLLKLKNDFTLIVTDPAPPAGMVAIAGPVTEKSPTLTVKVAVRTNVPPVNV